VSGFVQWCLIIIAVLLGGLSTVVIDSVFAVLLVVIAIFLRIRTIHAMLVKVYRPINVQLNRYEP
jgi:hypothetical protein